MDYDKTDIAASYNAGRDISVEDKIRTLAFFAQHVPKEEIQRIVDLGCGTGRFSHVLGNLFEADVVGVDPSGKMLAQARKSEGSVQFIEGSAEAIPVDDGSADMVFMSMVLHHVGDRAQMARECARVLCKGGRLCIRNTVLDEISSYPYLDIFPSIRSIIASQLMLRDDLDAICRAAGLHQTAHLSTWDEIAPNWAAYAKKLEHRADSFVARLPDDEFEEGLAAVRRRADSGDGNARVGLNVDQFVFCKK